MTLNKNAKAWVKALRSGKYEQGTLALRIGDRYCCLGVACDLAVTAGVISPGKVVEGEKLKGEEQWVWEYEEHTASLPAAVQDWLGIGGESGGYRGSSLAADNDGGFGFDEIAGVIESDPEGLFA